jgi:Bacterial PH domain
VSTLGVAILSAVVTAVVGVLVMEFYQTTPWLADKMMQWSVRVRYDDNPQRAKMRGEELIGLLEDLPMLFKFPTAAWFFLRALAYRFGQGLGKIPTDQPLKLRVRRRHWAVLFGVLLQIIGIVIGAFLLSQLASSVRADFWLVQLLVWSIAVVAVLRLAWNVLEWWMEVIIVTDKQIIYASGVITRKTNMMPLKEVTGLHLRRTVTGMLLGYGTLYVESVRQKHDLEGYWYLPRSKKVFRVLTELTSDKNI